MGQNDLEKLILENPDDAVDAIRYWWDKIPPEERDRVSDAVFPPKTYTPEQQREELLKPLKIKLTPDERKEAFRNMSHYAQGLLREIMALYAKRS